MNRAVKELTVGRYHYGGHDELKKAFFCLSHGLQPCELLKTLKGKSPYDFIRTVWDTEPKGLLSVQPSSLGTKHLGTGLVNYQSFCISVYNARDES